MRSASQLSDSAPPYLLPRDMDLSASVEEAAALRPTSAHDQDHQDVFVFIDNSNVFHGAQVLPDGSVDRSVRVSIKELIRWLELGRWVHTRVVAGSMRTEKIVQEWQKYDYKPLTTSHDRDAHIDELLHSQIVRLVSTPGQMPGSIVLVTGDSDTHGRSLVECVIMSLDAGWNVELCSWAKCLHTSYAQLAASGRYTGRLLLRLLDEKRSRLTFAATPLPGAPSASSSIHTKAPHTGAPPLNPHAPAVTPPAYGVHPPAGGMYYRGGMMLPPPFVPQGTYFPGMVSMYRPSPSPSVQTTPPRSVPMASPPSMPPATPPPLPASRPAGDSSQSLVAMSSWAGVPKTAGLASSPPPLLKVTPFRLEIPQSNNTTDSLEVKPSPAAILEETKETRSIMRELGMGSADPMSPSALLSPMGDTLPFTPTPNRSSALRKEVTPTPTAA